MKEHFLKCNDIEMKYAVSDLEGLEKSLHSHYDVLQTLTEKGLFPVEYFNLLLAIDSQEEKSQFAKRLLRIYLYASSKIKNPVKLKRWLLKGNLPNTANVGYDSMSLLNQYVKRIESLDKTKNKTIDSITTGREKITQKSNKRIESSIEKNVKKLETIESQYNNQKQLLDEIISQIESSLASDKKL